MTLHTSVLDLRLDASIAVNTPTTSFHAHVIISLPPLLIVLASAPCVCKHTHQIGSTDKVTMLAYKM
jgi:hypothetical protein